MKPPVAGAFRPSIMFSAIEDFLGLGTAVSGVAWANLQPFKRIDERDFEGVSYDDVFTYVYALSKLYGLPVRDVHNNAYGAQDAYNAWCLAREAEAETEREPCT